MSPWMESVLLLGLAAGPDELMERPSGEIQEEAIADLARRIGAVPAAGDKKEGRPQEEPLPQRLDTRIQEPPAAEGGGFIDFDWLEMNVRVGMATFSGDYHIDPSPCFGIETRAPILWFAPSGNPDGDYFGVFAELGVAIIKRTIEPSVDKPSGAMMSLSLGLDYTIFRNSTWLLLVKAGFQYASYGGVTDLEDGVAPIVGLTAGFTVSRSVAITLAPEYVMGDGESIILGMLGVSFDF